MLLPAGRTVFERASESDKFVLFSLFLSAGGTEDVTFASDRASESDFSFFSYVFPADGTFESIFKKFVLLISLYLK